MERDLSKEYPYGQFPSKYTKLGQQKYFEQLTNSEDSKVSSMNFTPEPQQPQQQANQNSLDISKLLPLLKIMGNKKNMSQTDMLQLFLPLIGGSNSSQIADMMQLLNSDTKPQEEQEEDIEISPTPRIDDYKRIE